MADLMLPERTDPNHKRQALKTEADRFWEMGHRVIRRIAHCLLSAATQRAEDEGRQEEQMV